MEAHEERGVLACESVEERKVLSTRNAERGKKSFRRNFLTSTERILFSQHCALTPVYGYRSVARGGGDEVELGELHVRGDVDATPGRPLVVNLPEKYHENMFANGY